MISPALLAFVQESVPTTAVGIMAMALAQAVIAWISGKAYDGLKTILPKYDTLPALVHQIVAPLWGLVFGFLTAKLGVTLVNDIYGIDAAYISAVLTALAQAGIFRWEKSRQPADVTQVLLANRAAKPLH